MRACMCWCACPCAWGIVAIGLCLQDSEEAGSSASTAVVPQSGRDSEATHACLRTFLSFNMSVRKSEVHIDRCRGTSHTRVLTAHTSAHQTHASTHVYAHICALVLQDGVLSTSAQATPPPGPTLPERQPPLRLPRYLKEYASILKRVCPTIYGLWPTNRHAQTKTMATM